MNPGVKAAWLFLVAALSFSSIQCKRNDDPQARGKPTISPASIAVWVILDEGEDGEPRTVIEWQPVHEPEVQSYSLTVLEAGRTLDEVDLYKWQVVYIPSAVTRVAYGKTPVGAAQGSGSAAELPPGEYWVHLFGYGAEHPDFSDPEAIVAAGRYPFTIPE